MFGFLLMCHVFHQPVFFYFSLSLSLVFQNWQTSGLPFVPTVYFLAMGQSRRSAAPAEFQSFSWSRREVLSCIMTSVLCFCVILEFPNYLWHKTTYNFYLLFFFNAYFTLVLLVAGLCTHYCTLFYSCFFGFFSNINLRV